MIIDKTSTNAELNALTRLENLVKNSNHLESLVDNILYATTGVSTANGGEPQPIVKSEWGSLASFVSHLETTQNSTVDKIIKISDFIGKLGK